MKCPDCDGTGNNICLACDGSGEGNYDGSRCRTCGGDGAEPCQACGGTGEMQDFDLKTTIILSVLAFLIGGCNPLFPLL
jgi:hypothetical protein